MSDLSDPPGPPVDNLWIKLTGNSQETGDRFSKKLSGSDDIIRVSKERKTEND